MPRGKRTKNTAEEVNSNNIAAEPKKRGRKKAEPEAVENTAEIINVPVVEEIAEAPAAPKRRGRKAAAPETAEISAIDEKPKKRGRKSAAEKTEPADIPVAEEIAEAPKKRGRKAKEEAVPETAAIDEKPKRRGRKPAAENVSAENAAEEKPKRRGRKPAADTEEKPKKRGRKSAAAAAEEKPKRRGRKPAEEKTEKRGRKAVKEAAAAVETPVVPVAEAVPEISPFDRVYGAANDKIEKGINKYTPSAYFAAEITLYGSVEGKFYVHYAESGLDIQPYEYNDADLYVTADSDTLEQMIAGTVSLSDAVNLNKFEMNGKAPFSLMLNFAKLLS